MKKIIGFSILLIVFLSSLAVRFLRPVGEFGQPFRTTAVVSLAKILADPEAHLSGAVHTEGRIVRQCPSAGCWFFLDGGQGRQLRVELGHLGLKLPQHVGGVVEVEGRLLRQGAELELVGDSVRFR